MVLVKAPLVNEVAQSPPMGWRSWNCFKLDVSQQSMLSQVDALVAPQPGSTASLRSLGFSDIGIDDGWQACGAGVNGSWHDATGTPLVNETLFPDMASMTAAARAKNVSMGFYMNNCNCNEMSTRSALPHTYAQDVALVASAGFSALKIDGCGNNHDIHAWTAAIAATASPRLVVENCGDNNRTHPRGGRLHWNPPLPKDLVGDLCTWQLYRVSKDIAPQFYSTMWNLQYTSAFTAKTLPAPLSRPGCWAYPDMLQVGRLASATEDRTHFGAWSVSSAPLVLGFDLTDAPTLARVWPILSAPLAVAINQRWAGHPGGLVRNASETFEALVAHGAGGDPACANRKKCERATFPAYQVWAKPQPGGAVAVFIVNLSDGPVDVTATLAEVGFADEQAKATDVWTGAAAGASVKSVVASQLAPRDNLYWLLQR